MKLVAGSVNYLTVYLKRGSMKISPVTQAQWVKVLKALGYAFVSTFVFTLLANPDLTEISQRTIISAGVAGVNAVLVTIKQLFTVSE